MTDQLPLVRRFFLKVFISHEAVTMEEQKAALRWLQTKPQRELAFSKEEAEELASVFFDWINSRYYSFLRNQRPENQPMVCYEAQFSELDGLDKRLAPEMPEVVEEGGEPLPKNDWLRSEGTWPFQLLFLLFQEIREGRLDEDRAFMAFMIGAAGAKMLRLPSVKALLEPLVVGWINTPGYERRATEIVRLLLNQDTWKLQALRDRKPTIDAEKEIAVAREALRQALKQLDALDAVLARLHETEI